MNGQRSTIPLIRLLDCIGIRLNDILNNFGGPAQLNSGMEWELDNIFLGLNVSIVDVGGFLGFGVGWRRNGLGLWHGDFGSGISVSGAVALHQLNGAIGQPARLWESASWFWERRDCVETAVQPHEINQSPLLRGSSRSESREFIYYLYAMTSLTVIFLSILFLNLIICPINPLLNLQMIPLRQSLPIAAMTIHSWRHQFLVSH